MTRAAYEQNGAPVSPEHFYALACDPRRSVAVEACAGAGKTWMLVSRILRALLEGAAPQEILAITFTKKAAGEMRHRLQEWLRDFAVMDDDKLRGELRARGVSGDIPLEQIERLRALHQQLLLSGRPVQIRTFHGWFSSLLGAAPMAVLHALGLPTAYELLQDDSVAVAQVWRRFQSRVVDDAEARADYSAVVASYGRHQAQKALEAGLNKRTEFLLADAQGVVDNSVAHFHREFPEFAGVATPWEALWLPDAVSRMTHVAALLGRQTTVKRSQAGQALERAVTDRSISGVREALFTQKGEPRKLGDAFEGADEVCALQEFLQRVQEADTQHEAWLHQQRMARLLRGLTADYAELKRERGWIDMGDLERAALALMSDDVLSGWVQERLDARIRHLLIDEFQDTNPLQWQALHAWLSGYTGAGQGMSVFIVGDPKQSIYRFRRAEPQVFHAAKAFVRNGLQGDVLSCDHTRRNAKPVLALVNTVMGQAQDAQEFDGFRAHTTESDDSGEVLCLPRVARAARGNDDKGDKGDQGEVGAALQWRDSLTQARHQEEENQKALECRQAARWLQTAMVERGLAPKQVMVLARKRERLGLMQVELAALHIPAQQPEKSDLAELPVVLDLVALLDVLVSPRHDLSLAQVLKSPVFGLSDADLMVVARHKREWQVANPEGGVISWWDLLMGPCQSHAPLAPAAAKLQRWQQWLQSLPPHDALSAIYADGQIMARYTEAAPEGDVASTQAHLHALLHAGMAVEGGRYLTAYALVRALRAGGNQVPVRAQADAVQLLTVHGAKGLEAPLVLMLDTDGEANAAETMGVLVDWPGEALYPQRLVFLASESRPPACVRDALQTERVARQREEINGLYVALTRARQTLVFSAMEPFRRSGTSWWQRLEAHATPVMVTVAQDGNIGEAALHGELAPVAFSDPQDANRDQANASLPAANPTQTQTRTLWVLPALCRTMGVPPKAGSAPIGPLLEPESLASRIGQAMHRLLEWVPLREGGYAGNADGDKLQALGDTGETGDVGDIAKRVWSPSQRRAVAREFQLDAAQAEEAGLAATAILQGDAAWAWDAAKVAWQSNEVPISVGERMLRIDRLVQTRDTGAWWVLDYKLSPRPQQDPDLVSQLANYRTAVSAAFALPAKAVQAAFLTPQGALISIE